MTAPSPHTHPAERETPAGEAMREAVAREMRDKLVPLMQVEIQKWLDWCGLADEPPEAWSGARNAWDAIASELARLTAERDALATAVARARREALEEAAALVETEKMGWSATGRIVLNCAAIAIRARAATPPEARQTETGWKPPAGWKLVPEEATHEMWAAFRNSDQTQATFHRGYRAMLAASPPPAIGNLEGEVRS